MQYAFDERGGLKLERNGDVVLRIPPDGCVSVLVDSGSSTGSAMLLKHGPREDVLSCYRRTWSALKRMTDTSGSLPSAMGFSPSGETPLQGRAVADEIVMIDVPMSRMTPEALEEINACLAVSGRVKGLPERLEGMLLPDPPEPEIVQDTHRGLRPV